MGWESEIIHLTYGDFLNAIDDYIDLTDEDRLDVNKLAHKLEKRNDVIGNWKIKRYKTDMPFITFNSPESTNSIIDYLINKNKRINYQKKVDDPLFYSLQNNQLSPNGFNAIFQRINDRIGFPIDKKTNRRYFTSHKLRKYSLQHYTTKEWIFCCRLDARP